MAHQKMIEWALRIGLFGSFVGHGVFALQGKATWAGWIASFTGWDVALSIQALFLVGILDIIVGFIILVRPIRIVLLWASLWTLWTAFMRVMPFIGDPVWETVERLANPGSAIALFYLRGGFPYTWGNVREWFK